MCHGISWFTVSFPGSVFGMAADLERDLILDVWREVCRHIAIDESVARLTPLLVRQLPVQEVLVRQIDPVKGCLDTVALGCVAPAPKSLESKAACAPRDMARIVEFCRSGQPVRG